MNHLFSCFFFRLFLFLIFSTNCLAQSLVEIDRPKIGLVLSGGGARGAAHAGVIKVLHELQIPIDYIAGVSMGAVVGGLYASGMEPEELVALTRDSNWIDFYTDRPPRASRSFRRKSADTGFLIDFDVGLSTNGLQFPKGIIQGQKFELALRRWLMPVVSVEKFDELPIPFRAIATDITTGEMVVLEAGDLPSAIRASMSVPGVFIPVEIDDRVLVDGGIANNLPIDVVREMGADIVIAVNVGFPLLDAEDLNSAFNITSQMLNVLIKARTEEQLETLIEFDLLIEPQLGRLGSIDFSRVKEAVDIGELAGRDMQQGLARLSVSQDQYLAHRSGLSSQLALPPVINQTIVLNDSPLSTKVIEARLSNQEGQRLDITQLESDISDIHGLDIFESTSYRLANEEGETNLIVSSKGKSWGPNYLRFGVNLEDDFSGTSNYNIAARLSNTEMNALGGDLRLEAQLGTESRLLAEWYQPLSYGSKWFARSRVTVGRNNTRIFQNGNRVAELLSGDTAFNIGFGREIANLGQAQVGYTSLHNSSEILVGPPSDDKFDLDITGLTFSYIHDTLDALDIPRSGSRFDIDWFSSRESLGSDSQFDIVSLSYIKPITWGRNTILNWWEAGSVTKGTAAPFELGGLFSLSGYEPGEIGGSEAAMMRVLYYRSLLNADIPILQTPVYLGASLEFGNVWNEADDIRFDDTLIGGSVFVMIDSFLGPVYLAYGAAEGGRESVYLFLGQTF